MTHVLSKISTAAGLALIASAAIADPSGVNRPLSNYTAGTTDIYLAGSSAVDLALTKFIANACNTNSLDTYRTDIAGKTYYLWTCESTAAGGGTFGLTSGNSKIAIHKNTNSSGDGVTFVQNSAGATVPILKTTDLAGCAVAAQTIPATPGISAYTLSNCGALAPTGPTAQVNFGFADSEPSQFNAAVAPQLTSAYPFSLVFGIPVTKTLRNALQQQQFGVTNDESIGRVPSISAAQINAIFTGKQNSWSNAAGVTGLAGGNNVHLIRRSDGSGTTRIFNETFVGQFCTPGVSGTVTGGAITTPSTDCVAGSTLALRRKQAGTSDDMAACLNSYDAAGIGAIGHLSTDYIPQVTDGYRFIKVDGVLPTALNSVDGKWKMWSEGSINYNTARGIPGDLAGFYNRFTTASFDAAFLAEVNAGLVQTIGGWTGGILGGVTNGFNTMGFAPAAITASLTVPRSDASVAAFPVAPLTKAQLAGYNLCNPFVPAAAGYQAQ